MTGALFLFGTLRHTPLLSCVAGAPQSTKPAKLRGYRTCAVEGQDFPVLAPHDGAVAEGLVIETLSHDALARLDFYETLFGYTRHRLPVETDAGPLEAAVYLPPEGQWQAGGAWDFPAWGAQHGALSTKAAEEIMARRGVTPPERLAALFPFIRARAASHLRANQSVTPKTMRRSAHDGDIEVTTSEMPFEGFFRVSKSNLSVKRFDGTPGRAMERETFVAYDAALVLPYDPVRDLVMFVEQFRMAPFKRGDRDVFILEPVAGLVDAGESPEAAAKREAREEARLELSDLREMFRGYAAPGYVTEYYYTYLGLCTLDASAAGIGGLDEEAEDIRSHVVSFETAMALLDSGEITAAPLAMMLLWLARERPALRAEAGVPGAGRG